MKEGSLFVLFCLYLWDPPNQDASDHILGLFWKALEEKEEEKEVGYIKFEELECAFGAIGKISMSKI
jgi:hypothetical protein